MVFKMLLLGFKVCNSLCYTFIRMAHASKRSCISEVSMASPTEYSFHFSYVHEHLSGTIWWPATTGLQHWRIREKQLTSPSWTRARHLTLSPMIHLSLNWSRMDVTDGALGG